MRKKFLFTIVLMVGCGTLFAQSDEVYRLKALKFFCQNKYDLLRINNPMLGNTNPMFILDLHLSDTAENEGPLSFSISADEFVVDEPFVERLLKKLKDKDVLNNKEDIPVSPTLNITEYCDCIFQGMYFGDCSESMDSSSCVREYGLSVSNVISFEGLKYVVFRISSYFRSKNDKVQFCLMEFTEDGNLLRCGIAGIWDID